MSCPHCGTPMQYVETYFDNDGVTIVDEVHYCTTCDEALHLS